MKLHPDHGGDGYQFDIMNSQYRNTLHDIRMHKPLPEMFAKNKHYTYFFQPIFYKTRDNWYYIFERQSGCEVWIDEQHTNLIYEKQTKL